VVRAFEDPAERQQFITDYFDGKVRLGEVQLWHYDMGVAETLGAKWLRGTNGTYQFFLPDVPGLALAPGAPGVPIVFEVSDDLFRTNKLPAVIVRQTGLTNALGRWHPGSMQYRVPARTAEPREVNGAKGYSHYEQRQQAVPYDLEYTLNIACRNYGGQDGGTINEARHLLQYVWRVYQPYCTVYVRDSSSPAVHEGEETCYRAYTAFLEDVQPEVQVLEVTGRIIGYSLRLRVEAELDLNPARTVAAVTQPPVITVGLKDEG